MVETHRRERDAMTVQQPRFRRHVGRTNAREGRHAPQRDGHHPQQEQCSTTQPAPPVQARGRAHGAPTSSARFGVAPNTSGAYMASTRVAGNWKRPALFKRTRYSSVCLPAGSQLK